VKQGFSVVKSYSYGLIQALGASVGGFACGWMMDKFGRKAALFICYFLGGFAVLLFGTVTSTVSLYIYGGLAGMLIIGAQIGIQVVAGESYPTNIRTTGAGWVMTFGRIGAILAGVLGGVLVQAGFSFKQFFVFYAIPCFIVAGITLLFRVNKSETLELIHEKLVSSRAKPAMAPARTDEAL
jgi:MFS family permease